MANPARPPGRTDAYGHKQVILSPANPVKNRPQSGGRLEATQGTILNPVGSPKRWEAIGRSGVVGARRSSDETETQGASPPGLVDCSATPPAMRSLTTVVI